MDPFTIFLLGMLAGLVLAWVAMRVAFMIARHRLTGKQVSVTYAFNERGAQEVRRAFREIGDEARRTKEAVDAALSVQKPE